MYILYNIYILALIIKDYKEPEINNTEIEDGCNEENSNNKDSEEEGNTEENLEEEEKYNETGTCINDNHIPEEVEHFISVTLVLYNMQTLYL